MNKTKYTTGPWIIDPESLGIRGPATGCLAYTSVAVAMGLRREVAEANAALIAAAPDLYESLREMVAGLLSTASLGLSEEEVARLRRADAALAKAEGRQ